LQEFALYKDESRIKIEMETQLTLGFTGSAGVPPASCRKKLSDGLLILTRKDCGRDARAPSEDVRTDDG